CGEPCRDDSITKDDHIFCCQGCQTVYTLLQDNGLQQYYKINPAAGASQQHTEKQRYAWLDDEATVRKLLDFAEGSTARIRLHLPQIHCASCIWLLENLPRLHPGFLNSKVNFPKREASITFKTDELSLRQAVEWLDAIGYTPDLKLDRLHQDKKSPADRRLYLQLGLAGFAFGNIMLLSFPEYLGMDTLNSGRLPFFLSLLNLMLAIPVLLFSGRDYLSSAWHGLRNNDWNIDVPISLGMLSLFGRSLYDIITQTGPGYLDSLAGLIFFLLVGKWFQRRTYQQLSFDRDYKSYFPVAAEVVREGQTRSVTLDQLEAGDQVIIRHGELIPADGHLLRGRARIDYSFVTGESEPIPKRPGDYLYAGGRQRGEAITVALETRVDQSYLTRLWEESDDHIDKESGASVLAKKVGRYFTFSILTIGFATLAYWWPQDSGLAINAFTAVLIIACPCALALAIPFTLGNGLRRLARAGIFMKNTAALERMAGLSTIIFDKTGTLTSTQRPKVTYAGDVLTEADQRAVWSITRQSNHPLSRAISQWLGEQLGDTAGAKVLHFEEIPGQGVAGEVDGHPYRLGRREFTGMSGREELEGEVFLRVDGERCGVFQLQHTYREGLQEVVDTLANDYQLHLLSGDNEREAQRLRGVFPGHSELHFRQSPHDKLAFVKELQARGEQVLMTGDGLNDAGALRRAEVGLVITEAANNFTPASDAIVEARRFPQLPTLLDFAKGSIRLVYAAFVLAFIYNIVGLSFAVRGTLSPVIAAILMPLSSITIVA
ncbi:MAG: heavy metal translocating P-type ATPase metal-binding domain-containing protein, partial [Lewinella sp.]|nr:heavy metal translocating P-type ATPase metal-binding domain-containing protein [Lewinella sp.]